MSLTISSISPNLTLSNPFAFSSISKFPESFAAKFTGDYTPSRRFGGPWGLAFFRTTYSSPARYTAAKRAVIAATKRAYPDIVEAGADPGTLFLRFVDGPELKDSLDGKTSADVRKLFNPDYDGPGSLRPSFGFSIEGGISQEACVVLDEASVDSILKGTRWNEPESTADTLPESGDETIWVESIEAAGEAADDGAYVLAVDATTEQSQVFNIGENGEILYKEYDGTMKVHIDHLWTQFYLSLLEISEMSKRHEGKDDVYRGWQPRRYRQIHDEL